MRSSTPSRTSNPPKTPPSHPCAEKLLHLLDSCLAPHSWLSPWRSWMLFPLCQRCFCPLPRNVVPFPEYQAGNTTQISLSCSTATQIKPTAPLERQPIKASYRLCQTYLMIFFSPALQQDRGEGRREAAFSCFKGRNSLCFQLFLTFNASSQIGFDTPVMFSYPPRV